MCERGDTVEVEVHHVGEIRLGLVDVDRCIAPIIKALNKGGIATESSCCGHGERPGYIALSSGQELVFCKDKETAVKLINT